MVDTKVPTIIFYAMIDLLESGKINTRLLCEIATHEDFRRFLTDIEIYKDLDRIISTIRENNKKDITTADTVSPAADAQKQLQDALSFEGSNEEKKVRMYLNSLGIDYDSLTKEELVTQINILKKSKHMKSIYNQRGKTKKKRK